MKIFQDSLLITGMIRIYRRRATGDLSCNKAEEWLTYHNLPYKVITPQSITYELIEEMLFLSENGFEDILLSRKRGQRSWESLKRKFSEESLSLLSTHELINFIAENPSLLKSPIIFNDKKLLSGYNSDDIRKFIPRLQRKGYRQRNILNCFDEI